MDEVGSGAQDRTIGRVAAEKAGVGRGRSGQLDEEQEDEQGEGSGSSRPSRRPAGQ